jgi:hypothetical protein
MPSRQLSCSRLVDGSSWSDCRPTQVRTSAVLTLPTSCGWRDFGVHRVVRSANGGQSSSIGHSYGSVVITNAGTAAVTKALVRRRVHRTSVRTSSDPRWVGSARRRPDPTTMLTCQFGAPDGIPKRSSAVAYVADLPEADRWLIVASRRPIALRTPPDRDPAWRRCRVGRSSAPKTVIPPHNAWRSGRRDDHRSRRIARLDVSTSAAVDAILAACVPTDETSASRS